MWAGLAAVTFRSGMQDVLDDKLNVTYSMQLGTTINMMNSS